MTTYTQKKALMFRKAKDVQPERRRSESRLKTYPSSTDVRNWCDIVEDRRQHILELATKDISKYIGKVIPIEVIINALLAMANSDITQLKSCLKQLWTFISSLDLNDENRKQLSSLTSRMAKVCLEDSGREVSRDSAVPADGADSAVPAGRAESGVSADIADSAVQACRMDSAVSAGRAGSACRMDSAATAGRAGSAVSAGRAGRADPAAPAGRAGSAVSAGRAGRADSADPAGSAVPAGRADSAVPADSADDEKMRAVSEEFMQTVVAPLKMKAKQGSDYMQGSGAPLAAEECLEKEECTGKTRQERERAKLGKFLQDQPTIKLKSQSPHKMVSKIKDLPSDFEPVDDPAKPGRITIKARAKNRHKTSSESVETGHPNDDKEALADPDRLAAAEALCEEQKAKIQQLSNERDGLKKKLEACLNELDQFKKLQTVTNPSLPASCQQEIEALEAEIKIMRSGNPSPEEEAQIIKREVEILKRYCSKLKEVETENEKLKVELGSRVALKDSEPDLIQQEKMDTLKEKLDHLEALTEERDALANKVQLLEKQLMQYENVPEDLELLKNRSDMLDTVLEERDKMSQKVKSLKEVESELMKYKQKAERVDELERELRNMSKGDRSSGVDLKKSRSVADNLERELQNVMSERDAMAKRIESMKKEMDNQKAKVTEAEMMRLERDRLQIKLNELSDVQNQYEDMMNKMKIFDNIKAERDMYKQKYEEVLEMECRCEMLKAQVDEARTIGRERDQLQRQVEDLEACICEQENEIRSLVIQVDSITKNKSSKDGQMNTMIDTMKKDIEAKDKMIAASQEQLIQAQQTSLKIKELEKQLHRAEHTILQKECHIRCLEDELKCKTGTIDASKKLNKEEIKTLEQMKKELAMATNENKRLQEIANKIACTSGDDHMKKMLKQSECAVKRIVQELGKQYKEWDHGVKGKLPKGKYAPGVHECLCKMEASSDDDCKKLREELEELQREKQKLEMSVRQIQTLGIRRSACTCQKELINEQAMNEKFEQDSRREITVGQPLDSNKKS
ncbi:protein Daple-like [Sitophilus oryzae]|uniref:Protein Daple-like n=1 Tax=Sitophilus oryzae TaxID=7048 RepID=A0A6J2XEC8_SITOR|nr:protein Daple-like [Sitophilus oryzae]